MIALDDLVWSPFEIPDGTEPVQVAQLRAEDRYAQVLLVRFPPGWARPFAGSYVAAEELVVLEGAFTMSGETYTAGDWAYFPRSWLRDGTASPDGMLALVRFDGPARWSRDVGSPDGALRARLEPAALDAPVVAAFGLGWPLRDTVREQSWFLAELATGAPARHDVELFELDSRRWRFVEMGTALPPVEGRVFARAFPRV